MHDPIEKRIAAAVWEELRHMVAHLETDELCELWLMSYFPDPKVTSLLGSCFLKKGKPINLAPFGPAVTLVNSAHPTNLYLYCIVRERDELGIVYSYCFPYEDWEGEIKIDMQEIVLSDPAARKEMLQVEAKIKSYASKWLEGEHE